MYVNNDSIECINTPMPTIANKVVIHAKNVRPYDPDSIENSYPLFIYSIEDCVQEEPTDIESNRMNYEQQHDDQENMEFLGQDQSRDDCVCCYCCGRTYNHHGCTCIKTTCVCCVLLSLFITLTAIIVNYEL